MTEKYIYSWFWRGVIQFVVTDCMFPTLVSTLVWPVGFYIQLYIIVCDLNEVYLVFNIF